MVGTTSYLINSINMGGVTVQLVSMKVTEHENTVQIFDFLLGSGMMRLPL